MLTKRGADILVRVEKLLDEAGKTAGKTSANEREAGQAGHVQRARLPGELCRRGRRPAARAAEELSMRLNS